MLENIITIRASLTNHLDLSGDDARDLTVDEIAAHLAADQANAVVLHDMDEESGEVEVTQKVFIAHGESRDQADDLCCEVWPWEDPDDVVGYDMDVETALTEALNLMSA